MNYIGNAKYRRTKSRILDKKRRQSYALHCLQTLVPPIHRTSSPLAGTGKDQEKERDIDELDREVLALLDGKQATKAPRQEQNLAPSLLQTLSATSSGDTQLQKVTRVEVEQEVELKSLPADVFSGQQSVGSTITDPWTTPQKLASSASASTPAAFSSIWSLLNEHEDRINSLSSCIGNLSEVMRLCRQQSDHSAVE